MVAAMRLSPKLCWGGTAQIVMAAQAAIHGIATLGLR